MPAAPSWQGGPAAETRRDSNGHRATAWCRNGGVEKIGECIKQVKDKNSCIKLMGVDHRVCKNDDPRVIRACGTTHRALALSHDATPWCGYGRSTRAFGRQ